MPPSIHQLDPGNTEPARSLVPAEWLEDPSFAALDSSANARAWIEALLADGHAAAALRVIAHLSPRKLALAWACESMKSRMSDDPSVATDANRLGVMLADRSLAMPSDVNRRTALEFAERDDFRNAGAWIAAAAGWAEGSIVAPPHEPVPWPDTLSSEAVVAALMSIVPIEPRARATALTEMIKRALASFTPAEKGV